MPLRSTVYIEISPGKLVAEVLGSGRTEAVDCPATAHPRTLMGDFAAIQAAMKELMQRLGARAWWQQAPRGVVHLPANPAGGYTDLEVRAFAEVAAAAGLSPVQLLTDRAPRAAREKADLQRFFE